jgi:hypothetical protein
MLTLNPIDLIFGYLVAVVFLLSGIGFVIIILTRLQAKRPVFPAVFLLALVCLLVGFLHIFPVFSGHDIIMFTLGFGILWNVIGAWKKTR